jgi:hypothetical protein
MPTQPIRMKPPKSATTKGEAETRLDRECLLLEMSGQTWYVPFDTLEWIPRVGETIQVTGGNRGTVTQVEYEFTPEPPSRPSRRRNASRPLIRSSRTSFGESSLRLMRIPTAIQVSENP